MFCSGCGRQLEAGQGFCPQCGRVSAPLTPPVVPAPAFEYELARYASKIRVLGILWLVWAGLSLLMGIAGLHFLKAFFSGDFGPWAQNQHMFPNWFATTLIHFAMMMVILRSVVCAVAAWGLLERTQWGRIMAIIASVICMLKIPFGTALGIATLVILLGYRNSTLYDNL
jgi:branched-subunit amino acid ABC-type transport system permease component